MSFDEASLDEIARTLATTRANLHDYELTREKLDRDLEGLEWIDQFDEFITLATGGVVEGDDKDDEEGDQVRVNPDDSKLAFHLQEMKELEDSTYDEDLAYAKAVSVPDDADRHVYNGLYQNLKSAVSNPDAIFETVLDPLDSSFKDKYKDTLETIQQVVTDWESGNEPKDKPDRMVHPMSNNILSEKVINSPEHAQECVFSWCRNLPAPVPAACHQQIQSLEKITSLKLLHFPPWCCLQFLLTLVEEGTYHYFAAHVMAWFQIVGRILVALKLAPEGSQEFVNESVAFMDWLPIPGPNKNHASHISHKDKSVILCFQAKIMVKILGEWRAGASLAQSRGVSPSGHHITEMPWILKQVAQHRESVFRIAPVIKCLHPREAWPSGAFHKSSSRCAAAQITSPLTRNHLRQRVGQARLCTLLSHSQNASCCCLTSRVVAAN